MTLHPFERFLRASRFEPIDHVPAVGAVTDFYLAPLLELEDTSAPDLVHGSAPPAVVEMLVRADELFPGLIMMFNHNPRAALHYPMLRQVSNRDARFRASPSGDKVGRLHGEEELAQITIPDPETCPAHQAMVEAIAWINERLPNGLKERYGYGERVLRLENPFDRLTINLGTEWFTRLYTDPGFVHHAMEIFTEASRVGGKHLEDVFGEPALVILADDFPGMIKAEHFEAFVAPYYRQLFDSFPGALILLHNDSDTTHLLDLLPDCGIDLFHFGYEVDVEVAKEHLGQRVALMGNLAPTDVMLRGTDEAFEQESRHIIEAGKEGGGFVFSTGGEVNPGTSPDRLRLLQEYAERYGRYGKGEEEAATTNTS
jgi:uroporphyrinogen decarboxylase